MTTFLHHCIEHADDIGTGLAAVLTAGLGGYLAIRKVMQKETRKLREAYDVSARGLLTQVKANIETMLKRVEPANLRTLGINFENGISLRVPVVIGQTYAPFPGLTLTGLRSDHDATYYVLETVQPVSLMRHQHDERETVTVISGSMTDLDTGQHYAAGESWDIPPNTDHRVWFEAHSLFLCKIVPPLPLASERPVDVAGLDELADLT